MPLLRPAPLLISCAALVAAGCEPSGNPADGGFFSGISGVSSGSYDARVASLEGEVSAEEARQAELQQQLGALNTEYAQLRQQITRQRSQLAASGATVPASLDSRVNATLGATPGARGTDAEKLASLNASIRQARDLSAELALLSN